MAEEQGELTRLLGELGSRGDPDFASRVFPVVYEELRSLAENQLRRERRGHTLQPTALVHEAWLKLADNQRMQIQDRGHFFAIAALAMRRVLVRHAEQHRSQKRGAGRRPRALEDGLEVVVDEQDRRLDVLALDEALGKLEQLDPRKSRVIELRYFAGLSVEETAEALSTSTATVKRDWEFGRVWLLRELRR